MPVGRHSLSSPGSAAIRQCRITAASVMRFAPKRFGPKRRALEVRRGRRGGHRQRFALERFAGEVRPKRFAPEPGGPGGVAQRRGSPAERFAPERSAQWGGSPRRLHAVSEDREARRGSPGRGSPRRGSPGRGPRRGRSCRAPERRTVPAVGGRRHQCSAVVEQPGGRNGSSQRSRHHVRLAIRRCSGGPFQRGLRSAIVAHRPDLCPSRSARRRLVGAVQAMR